MSAVGRASQAAVDLASAPLLDRLLRWRHFRATLQGILLVLSLLVIYDGFTGSQIAPRNLAGVLPWLQWRGLTILTLLLAGSLFCMACPFVLVRRVSKALLQANRVWPRALRGKWLAAFLLVAYFWFYEALAPWAVPWLTASLILTYFAIAFVVDGLFRGASFCKYLCPIGQFNFVNSTCSPLEVRARDLSICSSCSTKACISARRHRGRKRVLSSEFWVLSSPITQNPELRTQNPRLTHGGCELGLFLPQKVGNLDCTFCLDCMHACPHDNVGVMGRLPLRELWDSRRRSNFGDLTTRTDIAFLVLVLVFASFMNAFGMVGPFYDFERSVMSLLGTDAVWLVLAIVYGAGIVLLPSALVTSTAAVSSALSSSTLRIREVATRFSYSLAPLGFGMWAAHYGFHFMTGALTVIPVFQQFLADLGLPFLGSPRWDLGPVVPASWLLPIEIGLLEGGMLGSLVAAYRISESAFGRHLALRGFLPWVLLILMLFASGVWLMLQPMEMRGTIRAG